MPGLRDAIVWGPLVALAGCDWWLIPQSEVTGGTDSTGGPSATTGDEPTTASGTESAPSTDASTSTTAGDSEGQSESGTDPVDVTETGRPDTTSGTSTEPASSTGATTTGGEESEGSSTAATTGEMCVVNWENCHPFDGLDDNCDDVSVCQGTLKEAASRVFGPQIHEIYAVPGAEIGEFQVVARYQGTVEGIEDVPVAANSAVFVARYDAKAPALELTTALADVAALTFGSGEAGTFLITRNELGAHTLRVYMPEPGTLNPLAADLSMFVEVGALTVTASRVVFVGVCDMIGSCVGSYDLSDDALTVRALGVADFEARDVLVDDVEERMVIVGFQMAKSMLVRAPLPVMLPAMIVADTQTFTGQVQLIRIVRGQTPETFIVAGKVTGATAGLGDADLPIGDVTCSSGSSDLVVARLSKMTAAPADAAVRSACANVPRAMGVSGLALDPTGDVFVSGSYGKVLEFAGTTSDGTAKANTGTLFVARFSPAFDGDDMRWLHLATPSMTGISVGNSLALDEQHVVVAGQLRTAAMTFQGAMFTPNAPVEQFSGVLLALHP